MEDYSTFSFRSPGHQFSRKCDGQCNCVRAGRGLTSLAGLRHPSNPCKLIWNPKSHFRLFLSSDRMQNLLRICDNTKNWFCEAAKVEVFAEVIHSVLCLLLIWRCCSHIGILICFPRFSRTKYGILKFIQRIFSVHFTKLNFLQNCSKYHFTLISVLFPGDQIQCLS